MSDQPSSVNRDNSPKQLSSAWLIALFAGICVLIALAGPLGEEIGGWLGWGIMFIFTFVMRWIVTRQFTNPIIPTLCGLLVGLTIPKPAEESMQCYAWDARDE